ncbi:MAG TPA: SIS domain-containing protein, partial [Sulfurospirillum arcachonense]|nr:SIS domain-containing protein [Sulfurospirillum arcachonense]
MMNMIQSEMNAHKETIEKTIETMQSHIYTACIIATETIKNGNKILLFGNGGSAADA